MVSCSEIHFVRMRFNDSMSPPLPYPGLGITVPTAYQKPERESASFQLMLVYIEVYLYVINTLESMLYSRATRTQKKEKTGGRVCEVGGVVT